MTRTLATVGVVAVLTLLAGILFFRARPGALPGSISRPAPLPQASEGVPAAAGPGITPRVETNVQGQDVLPSTVWVQADEATVRLSPDDFPDIPAAIGAELKRRGCTIPQTYGSQRPHNVISGRFTSAIATDWAVLCSRDRSSSLLVFPNGSADSVVELAQSPDVDWLQHIGGGAIGFSHAIGVASPEYILEHYERYGGPKPPPLDHDGINDIFIEKGSGVRYWYDGRWLEFSGAD